jgi:hypothetical protein
MRAPAFLTVLLATGACGHDSTAPGGTVQLEATQAVTARIGSAGGQLRATDTRGRTYVLDIPPLALRDSVDITLTPVASYDLPSGASLVAAAQFAPDGLQLAVPGRLAIVVPGGAPTVAGFGYSGQGEDLHLDLLGRRGDTLFIPVRHFSGAGVAATTDIALLTPSPPSGAAVQAYIDLETLTQAGRETGAYDVQGLAHVLEVWATTVVIPALSAATSEQTLLNAVGQYDDWESILICGADVCTGIPLHLWPEAVRLDIVGHLLQDRSDAQLVLARALKAGIDRLMAECTTGHDLQAAANALYWEGLALANEVQSLVPGLESEAFYDAFCVRVVFESVTLSDPLVTNAPAQLQVRAGLRYGGGTVDHADPVHITVSASNAAPATLEGNTANGTFATALVPTGISPIFLGIHAALTTHQLDQLAFVVHDTTHERPYGSVTITPTAALLDPGAQAQFTATVTGLGSSAVTWSATGGTLSTTSAGTTTYTAGSTAGTYAITATSVADPTQRATSRIDILAPSGGAVTVTSAQGETRTTVTTGDGTPGCDSHENRILGPSELASQYQWRPTTCSVGTPPSTAQSHQLVTFSAASGTHVTISGSGADSVDRQVYQIGARGFLAVVFTVSTHPVAYHLTGQLQATSSVDGGAFNQGGASIQFGPAGGPSLVSFVVSSNASSGLPQSVPLNSSGTLPPGDYQIEMQAFAASQAGTNTESGRVTFTLELGP